MRCLIALAVIVGSYVTSCFILNGRPSAGCVDGEIDCNTYGKGICTNTAIRNWASINCPRYCGFCDCFDVNKTECSNLESFCSLSDIFKKTLCRKTCSTCVDTYNPETFILNHGHFSTLTATTSPPTILPSNTAPSSAPVLTTETDTQTTTGQPTTTTQSATAQTTSPVSVVPYFSCEDKENCTHLDNDGTGNLCTSIFLRQWAANNCPRYCGFCSCYDTSATCSLMIQYCGNAAVRTNCKASCELCVNHYNPDVFLHNFPSPASTTPPPTTTEQEPLFTESVLHFRQCSHASIVVDISMNVSISDPRADTCPGGSTTTSLAVIYHYCDPPTDRKNWVKTMKIRENCPAVPAYSPIAAFDAQGNIEIAAVFVRCIADGFLIVLQTCADYIHFVPITPTTTGYPPIDHYYVLAWH